MTRKPFCIVTQKGDAIKYDTLKDFVVKEDEKTKGLEPNQSAGGQVIPALYNPLALAQLLEQNVYHNRCVMTKARDVAGLGWALKPLVDNPSEQQRQELDDFFSSTKPTLTLMLDNVMKDVEAVGYGCIEIVRDGDAPDGKPALMAHIPSHTVRIHKSRNKYRQERGGKKRWFKAVGYDMDVDFDTGDEKPLGGIAPEKRASELIWIVNYTPRSDYYGLPDIIPALGALQGDLSRRDYNIAFFSNYGIPAYAVFITGDYDPGEPDETTGKTPLETAIETHFKTIQQNPHSALILSVPSVSGDGAVKVEFKPISAEIKEASFRLYRQDNRDEILSAHGVPAYRVGINESGNLAGNAAKESTEIYKRSVIEPRQEMLEAFINQYIVWGGFEAFDYQFKLAEIDTSDEAHDVEMIEKLFEMGAMTPNQIISHFADRFGLEPVDHPGMDSHYVKGVPVEYDDTLGVMDEERKEVEGMIKSLKDKVNATTGGMKHYVG